MAMWRGALRQYSNGLVRDSHPASLFSSLGRHLRTTYDSVVSLASSIIGACAPPCQGQSADVPPPLPGGRKLCYNSLMNTFEQIYAAARQIPPGRVATYGQLARLAGNPRMARVVGYAMHAAPADVPCHRVVDRSGRLSAAFLPAGRETHRLLLEMEGVPFLPDGRVDLALARWEGPGH